MYTATATTRLPAPRVQWNKTRTIEMIAAYKRERRTEVRDQVMAEHMNLVEFIANKFKGRGEPLEDLRQVGTIGLMKAIERFDPESDNKFSTYATPAIIGEIMRYLRDHGSALRLPRPVHELRTAVGRAIQAYTAETGQPPSIPMLATRLGVTEERVTEAMEAQQGRHLASLHAGRDESGAPLFARLPVEDDGTEQVAERLVVREAFRSLSERERLIIFDRFYTNRTQRDIARRMGLSQMQVSRLQSSALKKMRAHLVAC